MEYRIVPWRSSGREEFAEEYYRPKLRKLYGKKIGDAMTEFYHMPHSSNLSAVRNRLSLLRVLREVRDSGKVELVNAAVADILDRQHRGFLIPISAYLD